MNGIPEPNEQVTALAGMENVPTVEEAKAIVERSARRLLGIVEESEKMLEALRTARRKADEVVVIWETDIARMRASLEDPAGGWMIEGHDRPSAEPVGGKFPVYYGVAELENGDCPAWTGLEDLIRWTGGTVPGASAAIRRAYEAKGLFTRDERDVARRCRESVEFYFMKAKVRLFADG